jgi:hypothetical protein
MPQVIYFLRAWVASRVSDERGATMVEYGLMVRSSPWSCRGRRPARHRHRRALR